MCCDIILDYRQKELLLAAYPRSIGPKWRLFTKITQSNHSAGTPTCQARSSILGPVYSTAFDG